MMKCIRLAICWIYKTVNLKVKTYELKGTSQNGAYLLK